jgi:uncharacterized PurR-regulated membrane protein YhhQ (DUF165 family)
MGAARSPLSGVFGLRATLLYVALIPFINWSFTWAPQLPIPDTAWWSGVAFNPVTIMTGLALVVRDFAQREIGHRVLFAMAVALALTVVLAGPELALASGVAFAISELVDWALFTFTKYRLSTRIWLSSLLAAPVDSAVFLWLAESIRDGMFTSANLIMSVAGKLVGAFVVAALVARREQRDLAGTVPAHRPPGIG